MMRGIVAFAVAIAALTAFSAGCAADEVEEREAAYPEPVGYTPPAEAAAHRNTEPPPAAAPAPPTDFAAGAPESDVVVGDGNDGNQYADSDPAALNDFHSTLDPYGTWGDDPNYGTVWVPSQSVVGDDFSPYVSEGHWAYDDDYTWVSDYAWGWAPFHYGRWVYATRGWSWVPGRTYAGAWVSWRCGAGSWGYVGWAPLPPTWGWRGGAVFQLGFAPRAPYSFVANRDLFASGVRGRLVAGPQAGVIGAHTQPWVIASPRVGTAMSARLGPPPSVLSIPASAVARTSATNVGVAQARAFARPSTGRPLGATAPQRVSAGAPSESWTYRGGAISMHGSAPSYAVATPSHFGGRLLGGGFSASGGVAAPVRSFPGEGARPYVVAPRAGISYGGGSPVYRSTGAAVYGGVRSFGGGATTGYARPSGASPAGGMPRGGAVGGSASVPFYGSGGGFHGGAGGGGGFHVGVGGGGGFHVGVGGGSRAGGHGGRR